MVCSTRGWGEGRRGRTIEQPRNIANAVIRAVILGAGLYALLGGAVSLAGWVFDMRRLATWDNSDVSIQPNTCVLLMVAGLALLAAASPLRRRWAIVLGLGIFVGVMGGLTLLQYIVGADFGFNHQLMFGRTWGQSTTATPGRMGPPASTSFTLIGTSLVLLALAARNGQLPELRRFVPRLGLIVAGIMSFSLLGYIFGARQFYTIPWLSAIALQTSTMVTALAVGLICLVPERQPVALLREKSGAGAMARLLLPAVIVLPPFIIWARTSGEDAGWYDLGTSRAIGAMALIVPMLAIMWAALLALRRREQAQREDQDALRRSERELADFFESASVGLHWVGPDGIILRANQADCELLGYAREEYVGRHIAEFHVDRPVIDDILARLTRGERLHEFPARLRHKDGSLREVIINSSVLFDDEGRFLHTRCFTHDITERVRAEERLERALAESRAAEEELRQSEERYRLMAINLNLMAGELSHRVKNTLALVQGIAAQSLRGAPSMEAFEKSFTDRLTMLGRTHNLFIRGNWAGASLDELIDATVAPHARSEALRRSFDERGAAVILPPKSAIAMSMILHELATNAVKYGALSHETGRVAVHWTVADGMVNLRWIEEDGPAVLPPGREGFGSTLLKRLASYELAGQATVKYQPEGLFCSIEFPVPTAAAGSG